MGPNEPSWSIGVRGVIAAVAAAIVVVVGALAAAGVLDRDTKTVTEAVPIPAAATAVDGPDADTKRDDALPLPAEAQEQLLETHESEIGSDPAAGGLRGTDPTEAGVIEGPLAAQEWPGCRTAFVRNFSSRTMPIRVILWHETVSRENGLASQNALTARANDPRTQVSWNFLIGRSQGLCTYTVPVNLKAWHAGNANSPAVGIEVEADGTEPSYVTGAGKAKLFAVTRRVASIYNIPLQHAIVRFDSNCVPHVIRPGIAEHRDMGGCGGGHVDVCSTALCRSGGPESAEKLPWRIDPLIREMREGVCGERCRAKQRQRKIVAARKKRHAATHADYQREGCRGRMHEVPLRELHRSECRAIKRRGHRQKLGIHRAQKTLAKL